MKKKTWSRYSFVPICSAFLCMFAALIIAVPAAQAAPIADEVAIAPAPDIALTATLVTQNAQEVQFAVPVAKGANPAAMAYSGKVTLKKFTASKIRRDVAWYPLLT